jgi:hypothetical protein
LDQIDARDWSTYRRNITDLHSGNRGRDSKIMSGLVDINKSILKDVMGEAEHSH